VSYGKGYVQISRGTVGKQKTIPVHFVDKNGEPLDISSPRSLVCSAKDPAGNVIAPTFDAHGDQSGTTAGLANVVITAAQTTTGGASGDYWKVDCLLGESSGTEEFVIGFQFEAVAALA